MSTAVIYHYWCDGFHGEEEPAYSNMTLPIIPSIATLRAVNPSIPIFVLDISENKHPSKWGYFPQKLNFTVVPLKRRFKPKATHVSEHVFRWSTPLCSSVFDVDYFAQQIPQHQILCCDCDIMHLRDIVPLGNYKKRKVIPHFHCNTNTGYWYFDKRGKDRRVLDLWKNNMEEYFAGGKIKKELEKFSRNEYGDLVINEEIFIKHIYSKHPDYRKSTAPTENISAHGGFVRDSARNVHFYFNVWGEKRGRAILHISEFGPLLSGVLDEQDMKMVFGHVCPYRRMWSVYDMDWQEIRNVIEADDKQWLL